MNSLLALQGLLEIFISAVFGVLIFFISFKMFSMLTKELDEVAEIKKNNVAISVLGSSFIFGIMILVKSSIDPSMDTLKNLLKAENFTFILLFFSIIRILLIFIFSSIFSFTILWLAVKLFTMLTTEIDEMSEIKNNNIAISLILATLVISMSLILSSPLKTLLDGMVSSPLQTDSGVSEHIINMSIFLQGLIELGITLFGSIFIFFLSFKLFSIFTKKINEIQELKNDNLAASILLSSFIFSIMILVSSAMEPANEALGYALSSESVSALSIFLAFLRILIFFIASSIISFVVIWFSMKLFMLFTTKIDELSEIKNKNIAVSLLIALLIISSAFLIQHGLTVLLESFIKTPELGRGLIDLSK